VSNEDDLATISKLPATSDIETIDAPGGGKRVKLTEPNGYTIEIVHGIEAVQPIHVVRQSINSGGAAPFDGAGEVIRFAAGPSSVKRIGHAVLGSPKNQETVRWFLDTLGLVCSDDVYAGDQDNIIGQFSWIDSGDDWLMSQPPVACCGCDPGSASAASLPQDPGQPVSTSARHRCWPAQGHRLGKSPKRTSAARRI
jgi:hypothetical protein